MVRLCMYSVSTWLLQVSPDPWSSQEEADHTCKNHGEGSPCWEQWSCSTVTALIINNNINIISRNCSSLHQKTCKLNWLSHRAANKCLHAVHWLQLHLYGQHYKMMLFHQTINCWNVLHKFTVYNIQSESTECPWQHIRGKKEELENIILRHQLEANRNVWCRWRISGRMKS